MSQTTTENTAPEISEEGETAKKKLNKKLIIIILAVVLLGGAGGYFFFLRGSSEKAENGEKSDKETKKSNAKKEAKEADDEEKTDEKSSKSSKSSSAAALKNALADDEEVKTVVELQPFIVNLADDDEARYLRMTVSVGVGGEGGGEEKPSPIFVTRVRNAMLAVLSVKTSEDVLTTKGKAKLRKELLDAAQRASDEPEVKAIYITDFIVQL